MLLKEEEMDWGWSRTARLLLLPMAAKRALLCLMDETPQNQAPVTQVSDSVSVTSHQNIWCPTRRNSYILHLFCVVIFTILLTSDFSLSQPEPSTSRASLNFQEYVLSRPPLSRSHLHFPPLDASSPTLGSPSNLFSQPSTSSAPGPFSTGFSLVKEIKDNLSQHEDDNISTTSGFSSRASEKGKVREFEGT